MDREELEGRDKADLIDVILRQQDQIVDLQTQVAQFQLLALKKNGSEQEALIGAQAVPVGRFPPALRLILIAGLALACVLLGIVAAFRPAAIGVGAAGDFAPGSVTLLQLPSPNRGGQTIPVLLVNDSSAGMLALHARDPGSNCLLAWNERAGRVEDPCSGSKYTRTGDAIEGPSPRGLDRYDVSVSESGEVQVDVTTLRSGPAQP